MNDINSWAVAVIAVCALCTFLERAVPFLLFRGKEVPQIVAYLGGVLPMAIMTTLVFYCLRTIDFGVASSWAPQLAASALTVFLHLWKGNTMLSIAGGTICCMVLTQCGLL
ncbi:MAG: AzlD domain-containing protein [Acidaminococcaceae bacterium]|nr:AzlD domain-containing protein [Acidaminococcaceae bacterium]